MENESFLRRLRQRFVELNLFKTTAIDEHSMRIQRWSTRLYIPILLTAMGILLTYTVLHKTTRQIEVENPSLSTYFDLYNIYGTVECPCTHISAAYETFTELSPIYHEVCSSDFVSQAWIDFLFDINETSMRYAIDFRATASDQFQVLRELCQSSSTAINDNLVSFYNSELISGELLHEDLLKAELQAAILAFKTLTILNYRLSIAFMRSLIFGNELMPGIETAYTYTVFNDDAGDIHYEPDLSANAFRDSNGLECNCQTSANCHVPAGFYDLHPLDSDDVFDLQEKPPDDALNGWYVGCWPAESLLLSTLEILYNETILHRIITYVNSSAPFDRFTTLKATQNSHFSQNSTVDDLVEELFVEEWQTKFNYSSYFVQCQPQSCLYNINERAQVLYIITSLVGLYGGLSVILHCIIPIVIEFVAKRLERRLPLADQQIATIVWSPRQRIRNIWYALVQLNLFKSARQIEPADLEQQRWITRLYLALLALSLFILTLYSSISVETKVIQIHNPPLSTVEILQQKYASSLLCPCTILSIAYENFIQLQPQYHQICSSALISPDWIEQLNLLVANSTIYYADFRNQGPTFELLQAMCDLANNTVINALFSFNQIQLVSAQLLEPGLFALQLNLSIQQFELSLPNKLLRLLQLIRNITFMNQFITGSYANSDVYYSSTQRYIKMIPGLGVDGLEGVLPNGTSDTCSCANDFECEREVGLYDYNSNVLIQIPLYSVPNFPMRCFPIESLLGSSLECFYNNVSCLDIIYNITNETVFINFTRLDPSLPSRFALNSRIDQLLNELFIEKWSEVLLYPSYFAHCQPVSCSYTVIERNSLIVTVTTIAGLVGGLSVVSRVLAPFIISLCIYFIRRYRQVPRIPVTPRETNFSTKTIALAKKLYDMIISWNMFEDVNRPAIDEHELHVQRQSTRVYILLLFISIFILVTYTSLSNQSTDITVKISSLDTYWNLQKLYGSTVVKCPCTQLSIIRSTYVQLEPIFHQICSSDFVSTNWLNALFVYYNYYNLNRTVIDTLSFRGTAFAHFQSMSIMCDLAKQAVMDARNLFLNTPLIVSQMLDFDVFDREINATFEDFKSSLPANFIHTLQLFRSLAQANGFASAYSTNWGLLIPNMTNKAIIFMLPKSYGNCSCATSALCIQSSTPFVPGFVVGCLPIESFLRSTFECYYNQTCVNQISSYANLSAPLTALKIMGSRFASTIATDVIMNEMFIESWSFSATYANFFQQCHPTVCSYTLVERFNMLYVLTTLLGLYGGITILLKLVVPFTIHQAHKYFRRFRQTNAHILPMNNRH